MLYVQSRTPDDGRKDRPKHVEWYSINSKIVHLVGFTIEIWKLCFLVTNELHLVLGLRMSGAIPLLPLYTCMVCSGTTWALNGYWCSLSRAQLLELVLANRLSLEPNWESGWSCICSAPLRLPFMDRDSLKLLCTSINTCTSEECSNKNYRTSKTFILHI